MSDLLVPTRTVVVDLDGTIARPAWPEIGDPMPGVQEALGHLQTQGYRIVVHTCRTSAEASNPRRLDLERTPAQKRMEIAKVERWLDRHAIPYDQVWHPDKPSGDWYIDDRAIQFPVDRPILTQGFTEWNRLSRAIVYQDQTREGNKSA